MQTARVHQNHPETNGSWASRVSAPLRYYSGSQNRDGHREHYAHRITRNSEGAQFCFDNFAQRIDGPPPSQHFAVEVEWADIGTVLRAFANGWTVHVQAAQRLLAAFDAENEREQAEGEARRIKHQRERAAREAALGSEVTGGPNPP